MRKIIKGLLETPALLIGIILLLVTLPLDIVIIKNAIIGNQVQNDLIGYTYQTVLLMFILPAGGVAVKREFIRIFIRGER